MQTFCLNWQRQYSNISATETRRNQHPQECKDPRRRCFCDWSLVDSSWNIFFIKFGDRFLRNLAENRQTTQTTTVKNLPPRLLREWVISIFVYYIMCWGVLTLDAAKARTSSSLYRFVINCSMCINDRVELSRVHTSNNVEATLSNATSRTILSTTKSNVAPTLLPCLATTLNENSSFQRSQSKLNMFNLFALFALFPPKLPPWTIARTVTSELLGFCF